MIKTVFLFVVCVPIVCSAQAMTAAQEAAFQAQLESWAKRYFPAIVQEPNPPKDLLLGFLVDAQKNVLRHSVAVQRPAPVAVADELKRMFPERSRAELIQNGSLCVLRPGTKEKQYCVVYAEVKK